jgi:hypothetical protein
VDITTVLAVISSAAVFLAWFVLPSKGVAAPPAVELPQAGLAQEIAA